MTESDLNVASAVTGANLIAGEESQNGTERYTAVDPRTGQAFGPSFSEATQQEVEAAVSAAERAFEAARECAATWRAQWLLDIAAALERHREAIWQAADAETALGPERLVNEHGRTVGQLRAFAEVLAEGSYVDGIIDTASQTTPDLRRMQFAIGPVAVFGASNFPLAFGAAGGDTASALAAGCPVVAKAHPSHPATSELCARAVLEGLERRQAPAGLFSMVHGVKPAVGTALVQAEAMCAVGFTGSRRGGRALFDVAAARPKPIPVFAEMGSVNPLFITPAAIVERGAQIAAGLAQSITMGTGQFCTKPGLVFLVDKPLGREFVRQLLRALADQPAGCLLNRSVRDNLRATLEATSRVDGVHIQAACDCGQTQTLRSAQAGFRHPPTLLYASSQTFGANPQLAEEHFGPVSIVIWCEDADEFCQIANALPGSLAASLHAEAADSQLVSRLLPRLQQRCGRVVWNGYPTGVAVTHAMHHGGPYPATTASAHTSVGSQAIRRFLRPVAFQNLPDELLPPALQNHNPLGICRRIDGRYSWDPI